MAGPTEGTGGSAPPRGKSFLEEIVEADRESARFPGPIRTRFPPEPNGYLHIGHAKSICLNFGLAAQYGGTCNLRMDDTNPTTEEAEYVEAIQRDVRWLGFQWDGPVRYASDYFEPLYAWAVELVRAGKAYVCDLTADQVEAHRGTLTTPGKPSPWRDRSVAENLDLLGRMRKGEFPDGSRTLRAKIDMASPNMHLRDPVLYRILHARHHRTGDAWCLYPTYDFAHGQSDSIEGITHSICTLEFEVHRPLYDWLLDSLGVPLHGHPRQVEFARLNLTHTVMSKRLLLRLVTEKLVSGWDDPRLPTIAGLRRRGVPPEAIREFARRIGVAKVESTVELALLEACIREELNRTAERRMAVLRPLRLVIEDWPEGREDLLEIGNNPEDPAAGSRKVPFGRELWIERDDFRAEAPKKWFRLAPGAEVRLRGGYYVRCRSVETDSRTGEPTRLLCTHDPASRGGSTPDGRKVKGTIHWVSAAHAAEAEVRLYETLFAVPDPGDVPPGKDFTHHLNPRSLEGLRGCKIEPSLAPAAPGSRWQFERIGYFCADEKDSRPGAPVFNRTVTLRDTWAKIERQEGG
ncbi:MAG: glutamine--tRNA ligase/YqeY domain fusion protein [Planctomycetales bacterium]|nr:glutamine--tRNA ligase/YqeY domain fusion protein [Planctomycetales bacterium]